MRRARRFALICVAALSACSGGGTTIPKTSAHRKAPVSISLLVPRPSTKSTARVKPQYISAGTQSVTINGSGFNVTPSSPNCASVSGGVQCTFTADLPIGTSVPLTVNAYDEPLASGGSAQGNILSTGTVYPNIVEGVANVVKVTLDGTPASATIVISNSTPPVGTAAAIPMTITVYDAAGYAIAGAYSAPIVLSALNAYNLAFAVNGLEGQLYQKSSDTAAILYTGHGTAGATIQATAQYGSTVLATAAFNPQPAFGTELNVGTSLVGASAYRDESYLRQMWFTEPAKHMIATYPDGGSITEYAVPSGSAPLRLTATAQRIMFTESNALGTVDTMIGVAISEKSIPTSNVGVYQIGGWDSSFNTYFTEKTAGKIGKMDVSGNVTEFSTGNANSTPAGMVWCDGSSWWFADPGANAIGRVTNLGGVTYYPVPTSGAQPTEISANDGTYNGRWWFTEPGANKIASLDINGNITEYDSPGKPIAIVAQYSGIAVLTDSGSIEMYDPATGTLKSTTPAPTSSAGPPVGIFDGSDEIVVLRSDGTNGSIQPFWYQ